MTAFLHFNKENIKNNQNSILHKKFSSLFDELNPSLEGFSIYFYSIYLFRRLVFLIFQLFLDQSYTFQFSLHIVGSILCLIYYIKFAQLKEKSSQVILIASELTILLTFFCIFMINFIKNKYWLDFITSLVMYGVIGFILFEGLIEIYKFGMVLKEMINHFKSKGRQNVDIVINLGNSE